MSSPGPRLDIRHTEQVEFNMNIAEGLSGDATLGTSLLDTSKAVIFLTSAMGAGYSAKGDAAVDLSIVDANTVRCNREIAGVDIWVSGLVVEFETVKNITEGIFGTSYAGGPITKGSVSLNYDNVGFPAGTDKSRVFLYPASLMGPHISGAGSYDQYTSFEINSDSLFRSYAVSGLNSTVRCFAIESY